MSSEHEQSILITVGKYQRYLNLSMYEKDFKSPFRSEVIRKGTWHFMTTYPRQNEPPSKVVEQSFAQVAHSFYASEADAKDAVAWLIFVLEASDDGWREGFGGMPGAYIGKRRKA